MASSRPTDGEVVAFMDLGTNSVRVLLVRIGPDQSYATLTQQKEVIRLGEGEFANQYMQPQAMDRAVLVCSKFADLSRSYGAKEILAVATSAVREAKNQKEFLSRLRHEAGIDLHVISGKEEARLIYLGISRAVHLGDKQAVFIDIGGGSTEIIAGDQSQHHLLASLNLGAVRLSTLFFLPDETDPVPPDRYALLQRHVRNVAVRTFQELKRHRIDVAFGSSGTVENLTDIAARTLHRRVRGRDDTLAYGDLERVVQMLCERTLDERRKIPGINPERADIIVAGAAILQTIMEDLQIKEVRVLSDHGLREGMLFDYLSRGEHARHFRETTVRERSVLQLGRACGFDEAHARQVARLALDLFDSAGKAGLHPWGDRERELLEYSALLHDIGAFLSYNNHHLHTYYLIRNAELLGFDQEEISMMALIARFHRKGMASKKSREFASLGKRARKSIRWMSTLIRIAEGLDRTHNRVVSHARLRVVDQNTARLEVQATEDYQLELWGLEDRLKVLEKVLHRRVEIKVRDKAMAAVAAAAERTGH